MNYIEYMDQGGLTQNATYTNLQNKVGPSSNLFLKRNNWINAIRDAILQIKNTNAKNNTVATANTKSSTNGNVSTVNNTADYPYTYPANHNSVISRVPRPLGNE